MYIYIYIFSRTRIEAAALIDVALALITCPYVEECHAYIVTDT
jgi:hypothetical protein